jgi:hypothetical protein
MATGLWNMDPEAGMTIGGYRAEAVGYERSTSPGVAPVTRPSA